jgi:hypothetical protein
MRRGQVNADRQAPGGNGLRQEPQRLTGAASGIQNMHPRRKTQHTYCGIELRTSKYIEQRQLSDVVALWSVTQQGTVSRGFVI